MKLNLILLIIIMCFCNPVSPEPAFINPKGKTIQERILVPKGYIRTKPSEKSFGEYLQNLQLKKDGSEIYLYNGDLKNRQDVHVAVLDIDVGKKDLQQCADAVMRLRADYLFQNHSFKDIHFNFTNGFFADYKKYAEGNRIKIKGNSVYWKKEAKIDYSYSTFRKYLEIVFSYAGSASLSKELIRVEDLSDLKIGDVFIQGGFPGHAVIIVDSAKSKTTDEIIFLLAQSYMPAQDIQILKNPNNAKLSPWYSNQISKKLITPEWTFKKSDLKRF